MTSIGEGLRDLLRDLAVRSARRGAEMASQRVPYEMIRQATIADVDSGAKTCSITFPEAPDVEIPNIQYLFGYGPVVGETATVLKVGASLLVLGVTASQR